MQLWLLVCFLQMRLGFCALNDTSAPSQTGNDGNAPATMEREWNEMFREYGLERPIPAFGALGSDIYVHRLPRTDCRANEPGCDVSWNRVWVRREAKPDEVMYVLQVSIHLCAKNLYYIYII